MDKISSKEKLIRSLLKHKYIQEIRGKGLMLALILIDAEIAKKLISIALKNRLIIFGLLFEPKAVRITPPLTISKKEIRLGCKTIIDVLDTIQHVN